MPQEESQETPIYLLPCQTCGSTLKPTQITQQQIMYLCEDQQCPYPLNTPFAVNFLVANPIQVPTINSINITEYKTISPSAPYSNEWGEQKTNEAYPSHSHPPRTSLAISSSSSSNIAPSTMSASSALAALRSRKSSHKTFSDARSTLTLSTSKTVATSSSNSRASVAAAPVRNSSISSNATLSSSTNFTVAPSSSSPSDSSSMPFIDSNDGSFSNAQLLNLSTSSTHPIVTCTSNGDVANLTDVEELALQQQLDQYQFQHNQTMQQIENEIMWD